MPIKYGSVRRLDALHDYWFEYGTDWPAPDCVKRWFMGGKAFDDELRESFSKLADWARGNAGRHILSNKQSIALIIALDQLPRNIHRGTDLAFAGDFLALRETQRILAEPGVLKWFGPAERMFLLMPLQHSESKAVQEESLRRFTELAASAPPGYPGAAKLVESAQQHHDIVMRFGRFPHRNKAIGRPDTAAETEWLAADGPSFGQ